MGSEPEVATLISRVVRETSRTTGQEFFRSLVQSLASLLGCRYCMVTECVDFPPTKVRSLAFWGGDRLLDSFEYSLLNTPCARVMLGESRCYGSDIQILYPDDEDLQTLGAESYVATPVVSRKGLVLGHLLIMDTKPIPEDSPNLALLEIFAERAAAEMERAQATQELEMSRVRLRQVIDLVPHFIFAKDREGHFILANQAVADAYGTTVEELVGKTDADFNPSETEVDEFRKDDLEVIESGEVKVIEKELISDAKGRQRILQTTKIPFTSANSDLPSVLGVSIDISRQNRLEQQRQQLQEQMQHAQKMESLGVLAGGLAHDFNNLLTSILGNVDLACDTLSPEASAREYLDEIAIAARHSAELAGQMLAYSGKGSFVFSEVDLNHIIREIYDLLRRSVGKNIRLQLEPADDLPLLIGDISQLRQVVMNLILNAADALESHSGTIWVRTGRRTVDEAFLESTYLPDAVEPGELIMLEVEDDGCGMDAETLERLFDPFFTTKSTGRGLGLSALLGIVRSHGGTIKVESQIGQGAIFTVLLGQAEAPISRDRSIPLPASESQSSQAGEGNEATSSYRGTVLVADDEDMVLRITRRLLEKQGLRVLTAIDGEDALRVFEHHRSSIDAVLLDITMPKLDGIETLRQLRALDPEVKVLLASGYSEHAALTSRIDDEPYRFLKKPYRSRDLKIALSEALADD